MKYTREQPVFMVQKFNELKCEAKVQSAWRAQYSTRAVPEPNTIKYNVSKFNKTGSVIHVPRKRRQLSKKVEEAKNRLKNIITENPALSVRKASGAIGISRETTRYILRYNLGKKPYKHQECQALEPPDHQKRVKFAKWFLSQPKSASEYLICTDEAYFTLTESNNKQNNRLWLEEKPVDMIERPLHDEKILVWCGISAKKIYGPYFFENYVNQHNYLIMLKTFFWPKHLRTAEYKKYYFQQDGAKPYGKHGPKMASIQIFKLFH
jgi:hypothetical protein